jgi:hypothetical protein
MKTALFFFAENFLLLAASFFTATTINGLLTSPRSPPRARAATCGSMHHRFYSPILEYDKGLLGQWQRKNLLTRFAVEEGSSSGGGGQQSNEDREKSSTNSDGNDQQRGYRFGDITRGILRAKESSALVKKMP